MAAVKTSSSKSPVKTLAGRSLECYYHDWVNMYNGRPGIGLEAANTERPKCHALSLEQATSLHTSQYEPTGHVIVVRMVAWLYFVR